MNTSEIISIDEPKAAKALVDPLRNRILAYLQEPASAAGLATKLKLPRQKVNYHLGELEKLGLVSLAEERKWGGLTERRFVASSSSYFVSSKVLGALAADPGRVGDKLSAGYLIALAVRLASEVSDLMHRARRSKRKLATLSVDTVVAFRSATERAEFTAELTETINRLVAKYHGPESRGNRPHRLIVGAHPVPTNPKNKGK